MTKRKLNLIICWQLALSCLFLCGWTYTLKTNTPAGGDDPTEADDRMRETKAAFVERFNIDHYMTPSATSTYDAADAGKHRYVTFREPNDLTSMAADESALFSKDVSSVTELHWIDESDNVLQMTSGGNLNIVSADLLGTLANNTYFTAVDAAGTGTVDLIKADANDVAVVPDNSQTATNAAPTSSTGIVNKKYVVDQITANADPAYTGGESHTYNGGLIIKMGYKTRSGGSTTVTFGTAFPTALISASATPYATQSIGNETYISAKSTSAISISNVSHAQITGYYWTAIGH